MKNQEWIVGGLQSWGQPWFQACVSIGTKLKINRVTTAIENTKPGRWNMRTVPWKQIEKTEKFPQYSSHWWVPGKILKEEEKIQQEKFLSKISHPQCPSNKKCSKKIGQWYHKDTGCVGLKVLYNLIVIDVKRPKRNHKVSFVIMSNKVVAAATIVPLLCPVWPENITWQRDIKV